MKNKLLHILSQDNLKPKPENTAKINNYIKKCSLIPKSIQIFFLILHFLFGQDFGFINLYGKKTVKNLKYYSTILALATTIIILAWPFIFRISVWFWWTLTECVVNFCILKTAKYTVYNFLSDIHATERIAILEKEAFGVITTTYALVIVIAKVFGDAIHCLIEYESHCDIHPFFLAFYLVSGHAVDLMHEAQIVVRFYIYAYVTNMGRCLKQDQDMNKFIERYKKIADCQDKIRYLCDNITLLELFYNVPKLMTCIWSMLHYEKESKWFTIGAEWLVAFHLAIQIVIPAVIVQLIKYTMDDIRQLLNKWNMDERDPEKNAQIIRVMKYLKRRSLEYKIWGIIHTDLRLPLTLISICITYLIVIIQFTHLYD